MFNDQRRCRSTCGLVIVAIHGPIDISTADGMRERILEHAHAHSARRVIVDLAAVSFFDASGVRALFQAKAELTGQGRRLVLAEPSNVVTKVSDVLNLEEAFEIYPIIEAAEVSECRCARSPLPKR